MILADFYRSHIESNRLLKNFHFTNDPYAAFASTYARMAMGDSRGVKLGIKKLQRISNRPRYLSQWLLIEYAGRMKQFVQQAELVRRALHQESQSPDWIIHALLRSLDQEDVDTQPLRQLFDKVQSESPLLSLLRHRLDDTAPLPERILRLEKLAQLHSDLPAVQVLLAALYYNIGAGRKCLTLLNHIAKLDNLDAGMIYRWLTLAMLHPDSGDTEEQLISIMQQIPPIVRIQGIIASYLLVHYWLNFNLEKAHKIVKTHFEFAQLTECDSDRAARIFFNYVLGLCIHWQDNQTIYQGSGHSLHVIGESHSLSPHMTTFSLGNTRYRAQSAFLMGCKMFHLGTQFDTVYQEAAVAHIANIPPSSSIMFTIGEIDCRPGEGIWPAAHKSSRDVQELVRETVDRYLEFIKKQTHNFLIKNIIIQGVPAPGYTLSEKQDPGDIAGFLHMIKAVNERLKAGALAFGWQFLDVYAATADENGIGNEKWHLDGFHLKPSFYQDADKWLRING